MIYYEVWIVDPETAKVQFRFISVWNLIKKQCICDKDFRFGADKITFLSPESQIFWMIFIALILLLCPVCNMLRKSAELWKQ